MGSKFFDYTGRIVQARRLRQAQTLSSDDTKDPDKLFKALQDVNARLQELELLAPNKSIEVEVTTPSYGFVTINHNFGGPVRWWTVWNEDSNNTVPTTSGLKDAEPKPLVTYKYDFDFTTLSTGLQAAATFLTNTAVGNTRGLTFTRPSVTTVQTSAATIVAGGVSNDACIGNITSDTSKRGLVIQNKTMNFLGTSPANNSPRDVITTGAGRWVAGGSLGVGNTYPYADSPDNTATGCSREVLLSGGYGTYKDGYGGSGGGFTGRKTYSAWLKSTPATGTALQITLYVSPAYIQAGDSAVNSAWGRYVCVKGVEANTFNVGTAEARDMTPYANGTGLAAGARDHLIDYCMLEHGDFPTEATATAHLARYGDVVTYATGSELVSSNGQFKFYAKFSPKFGSTMQVPYTEQTTVAYQAGWYLFSWGAASTPRDNYAYIKDSDKKLYVRLAGGAEFVSQNAINFGQYQVVETFIQVGNNLPSIAQYRLGGTSGTWTDLVLGTIPGAPTPGANAVRFFGNSVVLATDGDIDTGAFPCWLHRLSIYDTGLPTGINQPVQANHQTNLTFNRAKSTADTLVLNSYNEVKAVIRVEG